MLVNTVLENSAQKYPDKIALVCNDERLCYKEINNKAAKFSSYLIKAGIKRHDRVAIFIDNSVESVIALFGVLKAGATFVMLSASMKPTKLNYILKNSGASFLITNANKFRIVKNSLKNTDELKHIIWCASEGKPIGLGEAKDEKAESFWESIFKENSKPNPKINSGPIDIDLSNIIYTSGSTGDPKGVMSSHYNVLSATRSISQYLEINDKDIIMNVLPFSFDYGLYQIFMTFLCGATMIIEKSFAFPYRIIEKIATEKITGFPIVPTMAALLFKIDTLSKFDFSSLRFISNTAAALPFTYIEKLQKLFPTAKVYSMYGLTECKRVSYLPPKDIDRKKDSVGIAMPNEEVFVVDEDGNEVGPDVIGELVIRGANVMQGYWKDPKTSAKVFRPGRYKGETLLYSGDLFKKDAEGYLYFVSRKDDMIKTKGERVSPKEIESVLHSMDGISEISVFGIPDEIFGQSIVAAVVLEKGKKISGKDIKKYSTQNLEPFMIPKFIEFYKEFPKSTSGKIDKKTISANYMKMFVTPNSEAIK